MISKKSIASVLLASTLAAPLAWSQRGGKIKPHIPEGWPAKITANVGDMRVAFNSSMHWGLHLVEFRGETLAYERPGISYGTVVKVAGLGFVGAGHVSDGQQEQVKKLVVKIDGETVPVPPAEVAECDSFELIKTSTIHNFTLENSWRVSGDRIVESVRLVVEEPVKTDLVYFFMYPFVVEMTDYLAETIDGRRIGGEFAGDKSFKVNKPVNWVAEYNRDTGYGVVVRILTPPENAKWHTRIWDRARAYKKHYLMTLRNRELKAGETFEAQAVVIPFKASAAAWGEQAAKLGTAGVDE